MGQEVANEGAVAHTCHRPGCSTPVPPRLLACRADWYALPRPIRDRIWETYVPGQEIRKDPSWRYLAAVNEAIEYWRFLDACKT